MRRLIRTTAAGRQRAADQPATVATTERSAEVFVAAVSGLSALVDSAWLRPDQRPAT